MHITYVKNNIIDPFEKNSLNKNDGILNLFFIGIIFLYVLLYPPFRSSSIPALITFRITIEALVLICLLIKIQLVTPGKFQIHLLFAIILVIFFGIISPEAIRSVLSFLNKLLFLFLLTKAFQLDYKLMDLFRKTWIFIWFLISFSAIIALIGHGTGFLSFSKNLFFQGTNYYDFNPLVGSVNYRTIGPFKIARYVGWMYEHGMLSYYFALNIVLSEIIYKKETGKNWFRSINLIGGLLTLSASFYFFIFFYFIFQILNKKLKLIIYFIVPIIIYSAIFVYQNPGMFLFISMSDRVWRIEAAMNILSKMNLIELSFGMGVLEAQTLAGGGLGVGFLSMLIGRGMFLAIFYIFLIIKYTKYNTTLMVLNLYYSLIFNDLILNPVSVLIIVLGYLSFNNKYFQLDQKLNNIAISR